MSRAFGARRRAAFLRALAETGNQALSAEKARVSRSWVTLHRSGDPGFDAACREAIDAAKARLALATERAAAGWGFLDGAELVVSGTNGRRTQVRRARVRQWTARVEQRFLTALASTCNVNAACAEVGLSKSSAYAHRRRFLGFAAAWDTAVEIGYDHLQTALLERGLNLFSGEYNMAPEPIREMTAEQAFHLLRMHQHQVHAIGDKPGRARRKGSPEAVLDRLERAIEGVKKRNALCEADKEAREREWALRRTG